MPSCEVNTFTDPYLYGTESHGLEATLTVTGRGRFAAKRTFVGLDHLCIKRFEVSLPRIAHVVRVKVARTGISFRTQPGPSMVGSGIEMTPSNIVWHNQSPDLYHASSGPAHLGDMTLPVEEMAAVGAEIAGCDLMPPRNTLSLTPAPEAMARLQALHAAAARLAEDSPEIITDREAARGLEQALIEAMVRCLANGQEREDNAARGRHQTIMRRFAVLLEANPDRALYVHDLCAALGVSARTLQCCCHEHLGMGPARFLVLRRLDLARRALCEASAAATTVTQIAGRFGFWDPGAFAWAYKSRYGELPSKTLRRPPQPLRSAADGAALSPAQARLCAVLWRYRDATRRSTAAINAADSLVTG